MKPPCTRCDGEGERDARGSLIRSGGLCKRCDNALRYKERKAGIRRPLPWGRNPSPEEIAAMKSQIRAERTNQRRELDAWKATPRIPLVHRLSRDWEWDRMPWSEKPRLARSNQHSI